jgi:transketolase
MSEEQSGNGTAGERPHTAASLRETGRPIVLEYKKKKNRKNKRYSAGLGDAQRLEEGMSKATRRLAQAVARGTDTYHKERQKSARRKRDGAIRDFVPNMAEGISTSLREASSVPADLARSTNTKGTRRLLRRQLRLVSDSLKVWRL